MKVKSLFLSLLFLFGLFCYGLDSFSAETKNKLTNVSVDKSDSGHVINLTFDKQISSKGMKLGFERNFAQLAFKDTGIDNAKIVSVSQTEANGSKFQKVFAYPYTADLTRVRLIFDAAKAPQGKITFWNLNAKTIRVLIKEQKNTAAAIKSEESVTDKEILREVADATKEIDIHNPESIKAALSDKDAKISAVQKDEKIEDPEFGKSDAQTSEVGVKSEPSKHFVRIIVALLGIVSLFVGSVFLLKKYSNKLKKLPFGKKERIIQVVATHYLGKQKSISLVKIAGDYMVLGVGNDGINLISKLGAEVNVDKYLEDRFWGGTFEKHLKNYEKDKTLIKENDSVTIDSLLDSAPAVQPTQSPANQAKRYDGVRDLNPSDFGLENAATSVTDRVELSSFRSGIKEKLSKLKPLA